jgi:RNA polymerase sigma-70 factor (ECF subfamily)
MVAILPRLRRFAYSLTSGVEEADDLVQAACERALSREHQWHPGTRLDSWMFRIIYTLWIDQARAMRNRKVHLQLDEGSLRCGDGKDKKLEARLMLKRVVQAMGEMSRKDRLVLSLICVDGMSYKDAADVLQVPMGTIMSRLARARRRLYAMVNEQIGEQAC